MMYLSVCLVSEFSLDIFFKFNSFWQVIFHHILKKNCLLREYFFSAVFEGSKQLLRSRRLKKLLELVLALGNYMNRGQRANARGFTITSLNNMVDTKSGVNKQVTLLHYLVETVDKRVNSNCVPYSSNISHCTWGNISHCT